MPRFPSRGLYAITDDALLAPQGLPDAVEHAILGGAVAIQYRSKQGNSGARRALALALQSVCRRHGVCLMINDDVELAREIGADGVHLGREDLPLPIAREHLGPQAIIGVSCYNQPERALTAQRQGADYVAFGRFFPSSTKPQALTATPAMLAEVRPSLSVPVVVIGGITPENGASLLQAGADLLAVIHAVFGVDHPRTAAERFRRLFA